jgi:hypothetical protein
VTAEPERAGYFPDEEGPVGNEWASEHRSERIAAIRLDCERLRGDLERQAGEARRMREDVREIRECVMGGE